MDSKFEQGNRLFRIEKKDAIRVLGVSTPLAKEFEKAYEIAEALWERVLTEGAERGADGNIHSIGDEGTLLHDLALICNAEPNGAYGITIYGDEKQVENHENWTFEDCRYYIGMPSTSPQGKFEEYVIPALTWAVFPGKSFFSDENKTLDERIYTEWLPTSGYEFVEGLEIHFILPLNEGDDLGNAPFEIWIPVKKSK